MKRFIVICSALLMVVAASAQYDNEKESATSSASSGTDALPQQSSYIPYEEDNFSSGEKEKGFIAPTDGSLTLVYDREIYRMREANVTDLYRLNGVKFGGTFHARIKGPVGFEIPIFYRFGYMKDTDYSWSTGLNSLTKFDWGIQTGLLLCTSYRFNRKFYITLACGPKFDFSVMDYEFKRYTDGSKSAINYVLGDYSIKNSSGGTSS